MVGFSALIVEDNSGLAAALAETVREWTSEVQVATSVRTARRTLESLRPGLILLDYRLPDGDGLEIAELAQSLRPRPVVVALSGEATAEESFRLARAGVADFLAKPARLEDVRRVIRGALARIPDPTIEARSAVGRVPIFEVEVGVRLAMIEEAFARSGGSVNGAARELGISRQALQQMLKSKDLAGRVKVSRD